MDGLEHRALIADVGGAAEPHRSGHFGGDVGNDVAVQVERDDHIEVAWTRSDARRADIDDHVIGDNVRVLAPDLVKHFVKEAVGEFHDVVLRHARHMLAPVDSRVLERVADDPFAAGTRDELEALIHFVRLPVLDAGIEILFVLPHDHEVDTGVLGRDVRIEAHAGAHVGVEPQRLANGHVERLEPTSLRRGDRALEEHARSSQRLPRRRFDARALSATVDLLTDFYDFRCNARPRRRKNAKRGFHDFWANAIAVRYSDRNGHDAET